MSLYILKTTAVYFTTYLQIFEEVFKPGCREVTFLFKEGVKRLFIETNKS
jgi:hypothetical protein